MSQKRSGDQGDEGLPAIRSYGATRIGFRGRLREFTDLYRGMAKGIPGQVAGILKEMSEAQARIETIGGARIGGLRVLDIGPGQRMGHFLVLASANDATGIDLDLNPRGLELRSYWKLWRTNGSLRLIKTLGRKGLLLDSRFHRELLQQLGVEQMPGFTLRRMDASQMTFKNGSFEHVFSRSAFEHIADPASALRHVRRVVAPGGTVHITVHLYTSDGGCHDVRILSGNRGDLPPWPHLRSAYQAQVRPNSYLNGISLKDWESLFAETLPGARFFHSTETNPHLLAALPELRKNGHLSEYSDQDLLTVALHVAWRAPS